MSYKKVGGLHHVRIGRLGFSFYWKRVKRAKPIAMVEMYDPGIWGFDTFEF